MVIFIIFQGQVIYKIKNYQTVFCAICYTVFLNHNPIPGKPCRSESSRKATHAKEGSFSGPVERSVVSQAWTTRINKEEHTAYRRNHRDSSQEWHFSV